MAAPTFKHTTTTTPAAEYIAHAIQTQLRTGKRVLWLVAGGSAMSVAVEASKLLHNTPVQNLAVSITDERYGDVGHPNSNWQQLLDAGFTLPGATLVPVLYGGDTAATTQRFANMLQTAITAAGYRIGLFGIGPDGHTAGILPRSESVDQQALACAYDGGTYSRITMTVPAIAAIDEAVAYVMGEQKWPAMDRLQTNLSIAEQPAQALKKAKKFTVFSDYQKGKA
ncbi:MAG TPA: 6-phosphogluconolactonase [Nevskiaceae bacterium]|nr:6-phosphogluconolactonase [Nevskiaceae bacterium]